MSYQSPDSLCPHHDGSELYVSNSAPKVGDKVVLRVRVPHSYTFARSFLRLYHDGEPRSFELALERRDATESWWGFSRPNQRWLRRLNPVHNLLVELC